jgi:rhodanese-related sulfurtransferase
MLSGGKSLHESWVDFWVRFLIGVFWILVIMSLPEISVQELAERLSQGEPTPQLIDVREPQEFAIAKIEGFTLYPLSQHAEWSATITQQLDPQAETYVLCHHGMRSAQMCQWLLNQGFTQVKNISGGIDAYAGFVDRAIPRY